MYISYRYICVQKESVQNKSLMDLKIWTSWRVSQKFCFLRGWVVFLSKKKLFFSCKTSVFAGLGALFGTFFGGFFAIFHAKFQFFAGLGGLFE